MLKSILIIDDNEADVYFTKRIFKRIGLEAEVHSCEDGEEALKFFEDFDAKKAELGDKYPPCFVLLDINMPLMNGWEFLEEYHAKFGNDERLKSVVFMMYSSSELEEDKEKATAYPFVKEYVVKPIAEDVLQGIVDKHFQ